jgi:transcriptional/translational regulatory protein YebC/TACO1
MNEFLEAKNITPISAELTRIPLNTVELNDEQSEEVLKLVDRIEQDEDVQKVYHNLK